MKVLVIGGAGYIGSHVVKELLKSKHEVVVFDNLSSGLSTNLFQGTDFFLGDILLMSDLLECLKMYECDAIIHLAALKAAGESMHHPSKFSVNNLIGSINIINAAQMTGINNFVFSSSAAVYGAPQYNPIDEKHPTNPENYYGFTKLKVEEILKWYDTIHGMRYAALRYFNAAGYDVDGVLHGLEQNPSNLLPVVMETAMGIRDKMQVFGDDYGTPDGTCIRDYIHVSDLACAHVMALEHIKENDESLTLNLGSESGASVMEMIETTEELLSTKINKDIVGRRAGDPEGLVASSSKAKEVLGWEAKHSDVRTLLETTWNAYKAN
jgi:UDP-glucose 4-epimerase